jgi:hypothetical protein
LAWDLDIGFKTQLSKQKNHVNPRIRSHTDWDLDPGAKNVQAPWKFTYLTFKRPGKKGRKVSKFYISFR